MAEFQYGTVVSFAPENGKRGDRVTATVKFENPSEAVKRAMVRISAYGIYEPLKLVSGNEYAWSLVIPFEAPPGTYSIEFFGFNEEGTRGPIHQATYKLS